MSAREGRRSGGRQKGESRDSDTLRLHGNGCALARTAGSTREGLAAAWLLAAALLAARRRNGQYGSG